MSKYSVAWIDDDFGGVIGRHKPITWRRDPRGRDWYRLYWGDEVLGAVYRSPSVTRSWDVLIEAGRNMPYNNKIMSEYSHMGRGFATRWAASEYIFKALGITPRKT